MPSNTRQEEAVAPPERYEEIVQRLTALVDRLERGDLSLEDSVNAFEQGIRLARAGEARLAEAERRVEQLLADDRTAPLDAAPKDSAAAAPAARARKARTTGEDDAP